MFLNVDPNPGPVPAVWGLGKLGQARVIPVPYIANSRMTRGRRRGIGQATSGVEAWLAQGLANLQQAATETIGGPSGGDPAYFGEVNFGIGCNGGPCSSSAEALAALPALTAGYCAEESTGSTFAGYEADPGCADNGAAAVAAISPQYAAFLNSLPASVWTGAASDTGAFAGSTLSPSYTGVTTANGQAVTASGVVVTGCGESGTSPCTADATQSTTAPSSGLTPTAAAIPTSVTLNNESNPGGQFAVGDQFTVIVTGPPNAAVTATSSQNGGAQSSGSMGTTDESGTLQITGTWSAANAGSWAETWNVAGSSGAAALNFTVATGPTTPGGGGSTATSTAAATSSSSGIDLSWLTNTMGGIPVWGYLAGAFVLLMVVKK